MTAKWKSILAGEKIGPSFTDLPHGLMQSMLGWGTERINGLMHSILGLDCLLAEIEEASCEPKTTTFFRQFMIDQQAGAKMVSTSFSLL